ncbi:MAG: Nif3-like dinuclear metal center hexameric protein [Gemmataceae bacterium]
MITIGSVRDFLQEFAPLELAATWDNVGLLLGEESAPAQRIMTCLTLTPDSAAEAIADKAQLVITHHPALFRPVKSLTDSTTEGRMLLSLAKAGIGVYSPHTAFDNTRGGINEMIAQRLSLHEVSALCRGKEKDSCKLVVFVPDADLGRVSEALFATGAGNIGQYSQCSFRVAGTGTFFGSESANPTIGRKGRREEVPEWRLEVVCPSENVGSVVAALQKAHSYEEPAFDVYPLRSPATSLGEGRIGLLAKPEPLGVFAQTVKAALQADQVQWVGDENRTIERVAIVCGSGGDFWKHAKNAGAHVLLTGEARFHDCLAAQADGLALVLAGHYATERFAMEELAGLLKRQWEDVEIWASRAEKNPLQCG